jgi:stage II sporulation protein D
MRCGAGRAWVLGAALWLTGCARAPRPETPQTAAPVARPEVAGRPPGPVGVLPRGVARSVRVVVASGGSTASFEGAEGVELRMLSAAQPRLARAGTVVTMRVETGRLTVDGAGPRWQGEVGEAVEVWSAGSAPIQLGARRYRGWLRIIPTDSGLLAVNHLPVEQYLRGVVPLEIGPRRADERAAVEAQAVAARSFTYVRMLGAGARAWDVRGTTADQVYGGADAERAESDAAIAGTEGLVLTYAGRVVEAPYSAACGGETAAAEEVFRSEGAPHLRRVSDARPDGGAWCEIAPGFRWERRYDGMELQAGLERHLRSYVRGVPGTLPPVTGVRVTGTTPSGRATGVEIETRGGARYAVARNDLRFVLRVPDGAIVPSTYLSLAADRRRDGSIARLVLTGRGNGHGVGMCQWGAIGRARAGQDARTILRSYYPGTDLRRVD